ncbi:hypothetical protein [Terribacillus sp. DMT04]|uniref:hypothetical protein n=1 Tax=Terribacillus sp. DMT04 TaxID=2850441 RepID=UPI001C2BD239|nr:hypothetical protein [Terribacillus sp. DMT04]QXE01734.1 hypothetical protein KS242_00135 [Terribacillus sp. DMT04]
MDKTQRLNDKQLHIIKDMFKRRLDGERMEDIATYHGISRKTLSTYKNSFHGRQLYAEFQKEMSIDDIPKFYSILSERMQTGGVKYLELFAKIHGLLKNEKQSGSVDDSKSDIAKNGLSGDMLADIQKMLRKGDKNNHSNNIKRIK